MVQKGPVRTVRTTLNDPSGETSHRYTSPPLRADTGCSAVWHDLAIRMFFRHALESNPGLD